MKKRILSLILLITISISSFYIPEKVYAYTNKIWDGTYDTSWEGEGTIDSPYIIKTAEELAGIAYKVDTGTKYSGVYFELKNDIYLNDISNYDNWSYESPDNQWTPIGGHTYSTRENNNKYYFAGNFDGNNHTIFGLYYSNSNSSYSRFVGLFGITENSTIENIKLQNSYVYTIYDSGSLVGSSGTGNITNCRIQGYVESPENTYGHSLGGIVGVSSKTNISYCYFAGKITSGMKYGYTGGIVGKLSSGANIQKCYNTADINVISGSTSGDVGGICGFISEKSSVSQCYSTGNINGFYNVGGIIGSTYSGDYTSSVDSCFNYGNISGTSYIGGIVGTQYASFGETSVNNCYNTGQITGVSYVGGITGTLKRNYDAATINNCYNIGKVTGNSYIGGITGGITLYAYGYGSTKITNCYSLDNTADYLIGDSKSANYNGNRDSASNNNISNESQMKNQSNYISWDFNDIWAIDENINNGYPYLLWKQYDETEQEENTEFDPYHVSLSYPKKYLLFVDDTTLPGTPSQSKKEYIAELYEWAKEYGYDDVLTKEKVSEIITKNMPTAVYADESIALTADQYTTLEVMRDVIMLSSAKNSINQWENEYLVNAGTINLTNTQEKIGKIIPEYSKYVKNVERNPIVTALYTVYSSKMVQLAGKSVYKVAKSHLKNNYVPDVLSEGGIEELYDMIIEDITAWKNSGIASVSHIPAEVWEDIKSKSLKQMGNDAKKQLIKEIVSYNDSAQIMYDAYNTASSYAKGFKSTSLIAQFAPQILFQVQLLELGAKIMETISDVKNAQYFMINYYFKHNYPEVYDKIIDDKGNVIEYIDWVTLINSSFNSSEFAESLMNKWHSNNPSLPDDTKLELMNLASTTASIQEQNINAMRKNIVEYWVNEINKENGINIYQVQYSFNKADSFDIVDNNNTVLGSYSYSTGYNALCDDSYCNVSVDGETNAVVVTTLEPTIKVISKKQTAPSVVTVVTSNDTLYSKSYVNTEESENIIYSIKDGDINATDENENTIISEAEYTEANSIVTLDKENLNIRYAVNENSSSVRNNIELDNVGSYGSTITWYSSNEDVISIDGTVNRQNKDKEVVLTAKISYENITVSKEFKLTVLSNLITVTFDLCDGSEVTNQNVVIGEIIPLPDEPERKDYYFDGWYYDLNYEYPFSINNAATEDISLYAKWNDASSLSFKEVYHSSNEEDGEFYGASIHVSEKTQALGGIIIVGLYEEKRLISIQIFLNDCDTINSDFYGVPRSDNYTIKAFCWSNLNNPVPLCGSVCSEIIQ